MAAVFYPECASPADGDGQLYPYQRVSRDLLRAPGPKNLLVASPTGSGKTFVIEECVRLAREAKQRLFIAEPLIALAEQIYSRVGGPGLAMRTGPSHKGGEDADVVVCTYEVLARVVATVPEKLDGCPRLVIDEFHFLGGDRGPVLQEILAACRTGREVVALSGTMPNTSELAAFLSRLNGFPTYVVGAPRRPIEISFFHYACAEDAMSGLRPAVRPEPFEAKEIGGIRDRQGLFRFLDHLRKWDCYPALFVTFSCRKLDEYAAWTASSQDFSDRAAKRHVAIGFTKMLKAIPPEDAGLFERYRMWADKGVAVHHSHAPVQYLELVSWLAERRAISVVFSSSTLSAGINLPVRTVCLAAASVPQKRPDGGGMTHVDISPLLFHQLVGRAGRPGFETVGNCILIGRSRASYASAQALMQIPVGPVRPEACFGPGEVLRAVRAHRSLAHEAMAVLSAEEHELIRQMERDAALEAEAVKLSANAPALRRQVAAALLLERLNPRLRAYARVQASEDVGLLASDAGFSVAAPGVADETSATLVALLTCRQQQKKFPFAEADQIMAARAAAKELLAGRGLAGEEAAVRNVLYCAAKSASNLRDAPMQDTYRLTLRELHASGCVDDHRCLTPLGYAACELRTCAQPHRVLAALLQAGELSPQDAVAFASQVLGEGGGGDEDAEARGAVAASFESPALAGALERLRPLTRPSWTLAVLRWTEGAALAELEADAAVGCLCRHLLRVSDCCVEVAHALQSLGASGSAFEGANAALSRGLPFLKRGGWKRIALDEADAA